MRRPDKGYDLRHVSLGASSMMDPRLWLASHDVDVGHLAVGLEDGVQRSSLNVASAGRG